MVYIDTLIKKALCLKKVSKSFLIIILILPPYFASIKSSQINEYQLNKQIYEVLISGKPSSDKNSKTKKASNKTIKALNKFKDMTSLRPYFKKARGYAVFPILKGIGIGGARVGEFLKKVMLLDQHFNSNIYRVSIRGQTFSQIIFLKIRNPEDLLKVILNLELSECSINFRGPNASADYSDGVAVPFSRVA